MNSTLFRRLKKSIAAWLTNEPPLKGMPLCHYDRMLAAIRPGDVVLVEGRSRVSEVIKLITQSTWSHSALYVGSIATLKDQALQQRVRDFYDGPEDEPLLIEAMLGHGTIVSPLAIYREHHLRLCRPKQLLPEDADRVIAFVIDRLGREYNIRQMLDMARFFLPWSIFPRRWRSSLFASNAGDNTQTVCSSMMAQAFMTVHYPILPVVQREMDGTLKFFRRNFLLFTPRDFDHSPYFDIIKYPLISDEDLSDYRHLPWDTSGLICNDESDCLPNKHQPMTLWNMITALAMCLNNKLMRWYYSVWMVKKCTFNILCPVRWGLATYPCDCTSKTGLSLMRSHHQKGGVP